MKFKIYKFKNVTSTNDIAIKLINKSKKKGCVCAESQTNGRGTYGKKWTSKKGNLFSSIFFQLKSNYPSFNEFSIINPVLISEVIKNYCKKKSINLKFPNDIFVNGKKICGILQELITFDSKNFLIIGIGINIISNPKIKNRYYATNIFIESKKKNAANKIVNELLLSYTNFFTNLNSYNYLKFKKKANLMVVNQNKL